MARRAAIASPPAIAARAAIVLLAVCFACVDGRVDARVGDGARVRAGGDGRRRPTGGSSAARATTSADFAGGGELVQELVPPAGARVTSARVLVGLKRLSDGELEAASAERHRRDREESRRVGHAALGAARRATELQLDGRRALRYRDRVGGALGDSRADRSPAKYLRRCSPACSSTAPPDARDRADALAATLFASLDNKRV